LVLPESWQVDTPDGAYTISSKPLRDLLNKKPKRDDRAARRWLNYRAEQLSSFELPQRTTAEAARNSLNAVLSRPEFAPEPPPGTLERIRRRLSRWVGELFARLFGSMADHISSNVVFWVSLAIAFGLIISILLRRVRQESALKLSGSLPAPSIRSWDEWISAAQSAARSGDLRHAIQCAYWAGVTRLQSAGLLPKDRTRTPREYLRSLNAQRDTSAFRTLAQTLERCWYAYIPATEDDFNACLRSLEALGCRVD
jgi:hypothetical protein